MKQEKQKLQKDYDPLEIGLPSCSWVEDMVLAIAMLHPERMEELRVMVTVDDFSTEENRAIWATCVALYDGGAPLCGPAVAYELRKFSFDSSAAKIAEILCSSEVNGPNLPDLKKRVKVLRDFGQRRKAIFRADALLRQASDETFDIGAVLSDASDDFARYGAELAPDSVFKSPAEILKEMGGLNAYVRQPDDSNLISTPFPKLNQILQMGGFMPGDLVILAGHTSRGKSAMAVNFALHAIQRKKRVAVISLEMHEGSIFDRLVSLTGDIDGYTLHRELRTMHEEQDRRDRIRNSVGQVVRLPISISYRPLVSVKKLLVELKRLKAVAGLDLVVIDYLQLMSANEKTFNRTEEVSQISRSLKRMAGELQLPVIALSQFSRESAKQDREPELHDLRESGSIEQDASLVLLMHVTRAWDMQAKIETGEVKLKIAKQRSGVCTWIPLNFHAPTGKFYEQESMDRYQ